MLSGLFPLLRLSLFDRPVGSDEAPGGFDWDKLVKAASKQTVLGLLADAASRLDESLRPPADIMARLQQFAFKNVAVHRLLDQTVADIVTYYIQHGIQSVLLKGQGIARCYPNPALRQCGDIDLYVGEAEYDHACQLAKANESYDTSAAGETDKHYSFNRGIVSIEVHRRISSIAAPWLRRRLDRALTEPIDSGAGVSRLVIGGVEINVPDGDVNAFYIFFHLWHHFQMGGIGLRQLCDWTMVLHRYSNSIDRESLYAHLKVLGLLRAWRAFGFLAVDKLGLPAAEMPFYDPKSRKDAERALHVIESGGNFGQHSAVAGKRNRHSNPLVRKACSCYMMLSELRYRFALGHTEAIGAIMKRIKVNIT